MIGRLVGIIEEIGQDRSVLIDVSGVGYEVMCTESTCASLSQGEETTLVIHTEMRDASLSLYGFSSKIEKRLFSFLNEVKGVGPKIAIEILSTIEASELLRVIGSGDVRRVQSVKGIGKKTAERIILELQDKVSQYAVSMNGLRGGIEKISSRSPVIGGVVDVFQDSILALQALGFSRGDSEKAVNAVSAASPELADTGDIVKKALGYL